ncbi:MAG: trehalose-phosphatase [Actinomycetia bacterium]|nr:trehalose-phosphatase [Actinomycetes bacterium]
MRVLPQPRTAAGREGLAALLAEPGRALVACDYDGTLAPIVEHPDQALPAPGAIDALVAVAGVVGSVAVVTGRPAAAAVHLADLGRVPGIVVLGLYGAQRWPGASAGTTSAPVPAPGLDAVRAALPDVVAGAPAGTYVEDKGGSLAVHTRRTADPPAALDAVRPALEQLAARHGLRLDPGRLVLELRPPGADKGLALEALVRERRARSVLFAGDDLGDLAAFEAVRRLRLAGVPGLTVASASTETPEVAAEADLVVPGPPGVVALLTSLARTLPSR